MLSTRWALRVADTPRREALAALLARPDPADLPRRAFRLTQPNEDEDARVAIWRGLVLAWTAGFRFDRSGAESWPR